VDVDTEFDRQRDRLISDEYVELTGLDRSTLLEQVERLRVHVHQRSDHALAAPTPSRVPFVVVLGESLVPSEQLVPTTTLLGGEHPGVVDRNHGESGLAPYRPIEQVRLPESAVYLLLDVARGEEFCGVPPEQALPVILARDRTPLTIHEGLALITHFPGVLEKNNCFMLSGSRRGDRRVPALWISAKAPKLGWCWDGNPHSWLGTASAADRLG